ncbi:glycosyltransferase [uncultured Maribacter sp.]|uniref:glycosyltransferase n=1 Tax=uncultured Maribacter sp. TaxID=431308 RepID=UPI0026279687|nr:glycosyltransferase [uncultured Maribacter sp.]
MKNKICCVFNLAPHYRLSIYKLMDQQLECDFYFGDKVGSPIKLLDYSELKGYKSELKNSQVLNTSFTWQKGAWQLIFKPYKHYIINGGPNFLANWIILFFAKILGKKVHSWDHGMKGDPETKYKFFEHYFYKFCNTVFLYGHYSKNVMLNKGFPKEKLVCIYNSLDYKKQLEIRENLKKTDIYKIKFKNNAPVISYIGRIQKSKKLDLLIESIAKLNNNGIACNLVIIGPNVENDDMNKFVDKFKIKNKVWFYGPCYDEQLTGNLLYNSEVCVTPGAIGLTAIHSMAYGTPVITSDNFLIHGPEFETIIPGETGDFYKDNDLDDLTLKIKKWINLNKEQQIITEKNAYKVIDDKYNPLYQIEVLKKVLK